MKIHATFVGVGAAVALAATIASYAGPASSNEMPPFMSRSGAPMMGGRHDAAAMDQMQTIHALIMNHDSIKRTVTNLPDGIRTVTESDDPRVAQLIKEHVASMGQRVSEGSDPGLPMESSALHAIFRGKDKIHTTRKTLRQASRSSRPLRTRPSWPHFSSTPGKSAISFEAGWSQCMLQ